MARLRVSWFCMMLFLLTSLVLAQTQGDDDDYDDAFAPEPSPSDDGSPAPVADDMEAPARAPAPVTEAAPSSGEERRALVPALFAFGDSLIDSGNNNRLFSFAKANYLPYGIDFGGPTGRFSNAYTILDQIGDLLGLPLLPPYSKIFNVDKMRFGVNYASAAAGILDITGFHFVERIPFSYQIKNFENTLVSLIKNMSAPIVEEAIPKCIFFVGMGSNDYLNNYIMPAYFTQDEYTPQKFAELLVHQYKEQLIKLYDLGARKFIIAGIGQMGCIPFLLAESSNGECSEIVNQMVHPFNAKLKTMIMKLNKSELPGAHFIFLDMENMFKDIFTNYKSYGFSVTDRGCCGSGKNKGEVTCLPMQTPCPNRDDYLFWDAYHPTSAVNLLLGDMAFYGGPNFTFPMNIQQLATL
ncbi:GDSL esterase/lipase At1g71691-like [Nicotiana sylvestris]|uniref:GDSL esterase/lipase At1g71691-like n=1 Tax=Nicotiana sylvestris TaxID=4096 RepID=A0A1U7YDZ4_NICSY|nr:PREDICTED: GDSL esterase/lipase At1g71691-like [Nicotiana sylvestris]